MPHFLGGARDVIDGTVKETHSVDGFTPFEGNFDLGLSMSNADLATYTAPRNGFIRVTLTGQLKADANLSENNWSLGVRLAVSNHTPQNYDFINLPFLTWAAASNPVRFTYPDYQLDHSICVYVKQGDTLTVQIYGEVLESLDNWAGDGSFKYAITYEYDR